MNKEDNYELQMHDNVLNTETSSKCYKMNHKDSA
jgi:hypothetical protein